MFFSFLANQSISNLSHLDDDKAQNSSNWPASNDPGYRARQLLSHEDQVASEGKLESNAQPAVQEFNRYQVADQQHTFWVDDLVKDCKRNHFGRYDSPLYVSNTF